MKKIERDNAFRAESESYRRRVKISPKAAVIGYAGQVTVAVILATLFIWASNQDYNDTVAMETAQKQIIAAHVSVSRGHMGE